MSTLRRILLPVDFSECSEAAVQYCRFLALKLGAEVTVLHVWAPPADLGPFFGAVAVRDPETGKEQSLAEMVRTQAAAALDGVVRRLRSAGVAEVRGRLEAGPARQTIVEEAAAGSFDLLVLGTHGRTGISHVFLGSVAEWVVRHAPVPVLTIRALAGGSSAAGEPDRPV